MRTTTVLAIRAAAAAQPRHEGAGAETPMSCDDGEAYITGASNHVVVEGPCRLLVIQGAGNIVGVDLTERSAIRVTGASNRITRRAPGTSRPRVGSTGAGNVIRRAQ